MRDRIHQPAGHPGVTDLVVSAAVARLRQAHDERERVIGQDARGMPATGGVLEQDKLAGPEAARGVLVDADFPFSGRDRPQQP